MVRENIVSDFNNVELLSKTLPLYINSIVPNFELPEKTEIEIIKDDSFGPYDAYSLSCMISFYQVLTLLPNKDCFSQYYSLQLSFEILSRSQC